MLFFPYQADIRFSRVPVFTILICLLCLYIFWQQQQSEIELSDYTSQFCSENHGRIHKVVMKKIADGNNVSTADACYLSYLSIYQSADRAAEIRRLAETAPKFSTKSLDSSHAYLAERLAGKFDEFARGAPENLSRSLWYEPDSLNPVYMISSSFAHGSWSHVLGNLFFFFAFSATIEIILGFIYYPLLVIALAIGTNLAYSLAVMSAEVALPTLGLSGVVMGMMGMFAYFVPTARIKCFFWFLIIIKRFYIPAWILALWYFGWDVYALYTTGTSSGINLVAHVSGFIIGFLIGMVFFRGRKREVHNCARSNRGRTNGGRSNRGRAEAARVMRH